MKPRRIRREFRPYLAAATGLACPGMSKPDRPRFGQMGLQLTLAFVGVALAAVITVVVISASNVDSDLDDVVAGQQIEFTQAIAGAAGAAYHHASWGTADLAPVVALVEG